MIEKALLVMFGEIAIIILCQQMLELIVDQSQKAYMTRIWNIAAFLASLVLLFHFAATYVMPEIRLMFTF